ncbi:laccase [Pholiota conissans]|uniref:Laccase n=1 Tax=Pholiota conissans TaxID=109636 RepID=A0A9P5YNR2_9AGAR|nr:laccase [Pholiota conissans]
MKSLSAIVALSVVVGTYGAIGPTADLHIANKFILPDGFNRSGVLAGPTEADVVYPAPLITGNKGDTFNLNVIDELTNTSMLTSTSIHWHGLFQEGSNWADGPVGVNQCPIASGHSFLYQFSVPDQAGTFWYHSHHSTQYCDGLRGALVIYDPNDPYKSQYDVDDDSTVITLSDWYHTPAPSAGLVPTADSTLINGLGRYVGGPTVALAVITVEQNKRYRFRLVSISCDPNFTFSIDGHSMTIIEVDAVNSQPLVVDSIQIFAGQRYSFILNANQTVDNYWVRALPNVGSQGFDGGINSAILRYSGASEIDPVTNSTSSNPMVETNLHPLTNAAAPGVPTPGAADVNLNMDIQFSFTDLDFTVNNATFTPPTVPVLLQILSGAKTATDLLPSGSVYVLPPNKVIEISLPGGSVGSPHPIHLHGHTFSVIRSAGSSDYNFVDPVQRDVVSIGVSGDNTTIRFETDNAGPWIMHCHIDWHLNIGLAVVFAEDVDTVATFDPPSAWDDLCPIYDALPTQTF